MSNNTLNQEKKIFVGGLAENTTKGNIKISYYKFSDNLYEYFSLFGNVEKAIIISSKQKSKKTNLINCIYKYRIKRFWLCYFQLSGEY